MAGCRARFAFAISSLNPFVISNITASFTTDSVQTNWPSDVDANVSDLSSLEARVNTVPVNITGASQVSSTGVRFTLDADLTTGDDVRLIYTPPPNVFLRDLGKQPAEPFDLTVTA